jgi:hypothetical protein
MNDTDNPKLPPFFFDGELLAVDAMKLFYVFTLTIQVK